MSLALLNDLAERLGGTLPPKAAAQAALEMLLPALGLNRAALLALTPDKPAARLVGGTGLAPGQGEGPLTGVLAKVATSGKACAAPQPLFSAGRASRKLLTLCAPVRCHDEVLGLLAGETDGGAGGKTDSLDLLRAVAALFVPLLLEVRADTKTAAPVERRPQGFVGNSDVIQNVYEQIAHVAQSPTTVLLTGESGTGKELAAQAIHAASARADKPFVSVNCAALPENLVESELFGHEKGAFTGAVGMRKGRFELADGGTLFLDEVGELAPMIQAKLLRVLQEHAFERLGSMQSRHVDVRIITATNRDLERMVEQGQFRRDLFYRLNVFPIALPPLRGRPGDILPLAVHFMHAFGDANGRRALRLSLSVADMLQRYAWPGNVRELSNVMERAVLLVGPEGLILPQHLPRALHSEHCRTGMAENNAGGAAAFGPLQERLDELERACIVDALTRFRGHLGHAAEALGLSGRVMALRMHKYDITYKTFRRAEAGAAQAGE